MPQPSTLKAFYLNANIHLLEIENHWNCLKQPKPAAGCLGDILHMIAHYEKYLKEKYKSTPNRQLSLIYFWELLLILNLIPYVLLHYTTILKKDSEA